MDVLEGKVFRLVGGYSGFGYIKSEESPPAYYCFSYDEIEGYTGESEMEIGLRKGTEVRFVAKDQEATKIQIQNTAPRSWFDMVLLKLGKMR